MAEMEKVAQLIKYATIIISSLPLIVMYPFFQKYFDKGVMAGSLKGLGLSIIIMVINV